MSSSDFTKEQWQSEHGEDWTTHEIKRLQREIAFRDAELKMLRELAEMVKCHAQFGVWPESIKALDVKAYEYFAMVKK